MSVVTAATSSVNTRSRGARSSSRVAPEASKVAPVDKFSLVLVALFAFVFLGERPSVREWLGIGLVASGVVVLAFKR